MPNNVFAPSIEIKNLMGVTSCELPLNQFMVLIGEQSTGKSTICKSIYYLQKFPEILTRHLQKLAIEGNPEFHITQNASLDVEDRRKAMDAVMREQKELFVQIFGISWNKPDLEMKYRFTDEYFMRVFIEPPDNYLSVRLCQPLLSKALHCVQEVWRIYVYEIRDASSMQKSKLRSQIYSRVEKMVSEIFGMEKSIAYIPAGRSLLTLTSQQGGINPHSLDHITSSFVGLISAVRNKFSDRRPMPNEDEEQDYTHEILTLWNEIVALLKGEYHIVDGQERLSIPVNYGRQDLPLNYTSSGQQEMLWVLNSLYLWALEKEKLFVIIEEPEAHLFPEAQKKMMEIISRFINLTGSSVLITTHSPYILTAANNLIFADHVRGKIDNKEAVDKFVPQKTQVNYQHFSAWYVGGKPYLNSIMNQDYFEIEAGRIDGISEKLNRIYGDLYELLPEEVEE